MLSDFNVEQVKNNKTNLRFIPQKGLNGNLGFTDHTFWLKFQLHNRTGVSIFYYLETAEPVTDRVNLYLFNNTKSYHTQQSGDNIPFIKRSVVLRKTTFKIELQAGERKSAYLEVKNDGEKQLYQH